jgi:hypothetical protein
MRNTFKYRDAIYSLHHATFGYKRVNGKIYCSQVRFLVLTATSMKTAIIILPVVRNGVVKRHIL